MITYTSENPELHVLTAEGSTIAQNGSHEFLVWQALDSTTPLTAAAIEAKVGKDVAKIGQGKAMKNKWIVKNGDGFLRKVRPLGVDSREAAADPVRMGSQEAAPVDETKAQLLTVQTSGAHPTAAVLADLRKRKLVEKKCGLLPLYELDRVAELSDRQQEALLLQGSQGARVQPQRGEAGSGADRRASRLVRLLTLLAMLRADFEHMKG